MKKLIAIVLLSVAPLAAPTAALADRAEIHTSWRNDLAIDGWDAVSFFAGSPQRGRTEFQTRYKDAIWRFDTQANLDLFLLNPERFTPEYGGYCAWAVANDKLAPGRPQHWHIEDGRLYLNYSRRVQKRWDALRDEFIVRADENWPDILRD